VTTPPLLLKPLCPPRRRLAPAPQNATLTSLSLVITGPGTCTVPDCPIPLVLTAGQSVVCRYNCTDTVTAVKAVATMNAGTGDEGFTSGNATSVTASPVPGPSQCVKLDSATFTADSAPTPWPPG
jgi:hypothetical protein